MFGQFLEPLMISALDLKSNLRRFHARHGLGFSRLRLPGLDCTKFYSFSHAQAIWFPSASNLTASIAPHRIWCKTGYVILFGAA
jgi:hypothetical protein